MQVENKSTRILGVGVGVETTSGLIGETVRFLPGTTVTIAEQHEKPLMDSKFFEAYCDKGWLSVLDGGDSPDAPVDDIGSKDEVKTATQKVQADGKNKG